MSRKLAGEVRRLKLRKHRRRQEELVLEGVRLVREALGRGVEVRAVLYSPALLARPGGQELLGQLEARGARVVAVDGRTLADLSEVETSQGLVVVARRPRPAPAAGDLWLLVDAVSDPGNLGTMLRSAHAAGAGAVYLLPGCADPYGPKALRAAMGSAFALNLFELEHLEPALGQWRREGRRLVLADAGSGLAPYEVDLTRPVILALGGEARGPSAGLRAAAEVSVRIPMPGGAESLNVAMAASILLYETVRQRACLPPGPCDIIGPRGSPTLGGAG